MPQLNPAPWLLVLLFSWLIFLTIIPYKVLDHTTPNEPAARGTQLLHKTTWTWPWS
nr:ATP synthase F0 subunit 8 [Bothus maculiferus]